MSAVGGVGGALPPSRHEQLRQAAVELESVFYAQLFAVMRESLPEDGGLVERSSGEKMFTAMLDEQVARAAAARHAGGLADAMARQLGRHLPPEDAAPNAAPAAGSVDVRSR